MGRGNLKIMGKIYANYRKELDAKKKDRETDDMVRYEKFLVINPDSEMQYTATKAPNTHSGLPTKVYDQVVKGSAFKAVSDALASLNGQGDVASVRIVDAISGKSVIIHKGEAVTPSAVIDSLAGKKRANESFIRVAWPMDRDYGKGVSRDTLRQIGGIGAWEVALHSSKTGMEIYSHTHGYAMPGETKVDMFDSAAAMRDAIAYRGGSAPKSSDDVPSLR